MVRDVVALTSVVRSAGVRCDFRDVYRAVHAIYCIESCSDQSDVLNLLGQGAPSFSLLVVAPLVHRQGHDAVLAVSKEVDRAR